MEHIQAAEFVRQTLAQTIRRIRFHKARIGHKTDYATVADAVACPADGADVGVIQRVLVGGGGMRRVSLADAPVQLRVGDVGVVVVGAFLPGGIRRVADDHANIQRLLFVAACAVLFQELIHQVGLFMELEGVG